MSTANIHPTAIIDDTAVIGDNAEVGPFSIVGPHCEIGEGTSLLSHVVVDRYTTLGKNCQVSPGAVLGGLPQDLRFEEKPTYVNIGDGCLIRECVTVNRATQESGTTSVGDNCMLMAYSHVGHDCQLGDEVIMANSSHLGGFVTVGDGAFLGGGSVYHQFIRIGRLAIVSGGSASRQDIPPFSTTAGNPILVIGLNKVGLKRRGIDLETRTALKKAYQLLWFSGLNYTQAETAIRATIPPNSAVEELLAFFQASKRGVLRAKSRHRAQQGEEALEMAQG